MELVEIYAELFDMKTEDLMKGTVKRSKKSIKEVNDLARNTIECAKEVSKVIYKTEDDSKFEYLQAVLNMELQCASKYAKLIETDIDVAI